MLKTLAILLLLATPASAFTCEQLANTAASVMKARQAGYSKEFLLSLIPTSGDRVDRAIAAGIVEASFKTPILPKYKLSDFIELYRNGAYSECMTGELFQK